MKNSLFVLFLLTTFFSCQNNIEQYRAGIEDIGSQYDSITTVVNSFADMLNAEHSNFTAMTSKMEEDGAALPTLSEEEQTKLTAAKESFTNAGSGLSEMVQSVEAFKTEWAAKAEEVTALKDGLAEGTLGADVATKIADLNTFLSDAGTKVSEWTGQLESTKNAIAASQSNYSSLVTQMATSEN